MRIALDAMGGDNGSPVNVLGAIQACREWRDIEIILVGDRETLTKQLREQSGASDTRMSRSARARPSAVNLSPSLASVSESSASGRQIAAARAIASTRSENVSTTTRPP